MAIFTYQEVSATHPDSLRIYNWAATSRCRMLVCFPHKVNSKIGVAVLNRKTFDEAQSTGSVSGPLTSHSTRPSMSQRGTILCRAIFLVFIELPGIKSDISLPCPTSQCFILMHERLFELNLTLAQPKHELSGLPKEQNRV